MPRNLSNKLTWLNNQKGFFVDLLMKMFKTPLLKVSSMFQSTQQTFFIISRVSFPLNKIWSPRWRRRLKKKRRKEFKCTKFTSPNWSRKISPTAKWFAISVKVPTMKTTTKLFFVPSATFQSIKIVTTYQSYQKTTGFVSLVRVMGKRGKCFLALFVNAEAGLCF